jgi:hypothetical protein
MYTVRFDRGFYTMYMYELILYTRILKSAHFERDIEEKSEYRERGAFNAKKPCLMHVHVHAILKYSRNNIITIRIRMRRHSNSPRMFTPYPHDEHPLQKSGLHNGLHNLSLSPPLPRFVGPDTVGVVEALT